MKCQICLKNDANIFFTQIVNNEKVVLNLCSECAKKKGISIEIEHPLHISVTDTIIKPDKNDSFSINISNISCPVCGLTIEEFKSSGLFGCDDCHIAFETLISEIVKQVSGLSGKSETETDNNTVIEEKKVTGNEPSTEADTETVLKQMREKLRKCVEVEDYEQAAELRDRITAIEKGDDIK